MEKSDLVVYGITISGKHPDFLQKRYFGVAINLDDAMNLVQEKAESDGWSQIDLEDVSRLGDLSFARWLSEDEQMEHDPDLDERKRQELRFEITEVPECQ
jgi:hypothetical protein